MKELTTEQRDEIKVKSMELVIAEVLDDNSPVALFGYFLDWLNENTEEEVQLTPKDDGSDLDCLDAIEHYTALRDANKPKCPNCGSVE